MSHHPTSKHQCTTIQFNSHCMSAKIAANAIQTLINQRHTLDWGCSNCTNISTWWCSPCSFYKRWAKWQGNFHEGAWISGCPQSFEFFSLSHTLTETDHGWMATFLILYNQTLFYSPPLSHLLILLLLLVSSNIYPNPGPARLLNKLQIPMLCLHPWGWIGLRLPGFI